MPIKIHPFTHCLSSVSQICTQISGLNNGNSIPYLQATLYPMHSVSVILMTLLGRHVYTFNKVALSFNMPHAASVICWLRKGILSPPPCPQPKVSATFATIMAFNPFVNKFGVYLDFMCTCQGCRLLLSWCCCLPKMPLRIVISGFLAKLLACRPPQAPLYNHCKCTVRGAGVGQGMASANGCSECTFAAIFCHFFCLARFEKNPLFGRF